MGKLALQRIFRPLEFNPGGRIEVARGRWFSCPTEAWVRTIFHDALAALKIQRGFDRVIPGLLECNFVADWARVEARAMHVEEQLRRPDDERRNTSLAVLFLAGCSTTPPVGTGRTVTFPDPQLQYSDQPQPK